MSLAKKSVKWLVALVVVFALVLTATFALSTGVANASAEVTQSSVYLVAETTNATFSYSKGSTIDVYYYLSLPTNYASTSTGMFEMHVAPTWKIGNTVLAPSTITLNTAFENAYGLDDEDTIADYLAGENSQFAITADVLDIANIVGATVTAVNDFTTTENAWLFKASYPTDANTTAGLYEYSFGVNDHFAYGDSFRYSFNTVESTFFVKNTLTIGFEEDAYEYSYHTSSADIQSELMEDLTITGEIDGYSVTGVSVEEMVSHNDAWAYLSTASVATYTIRPTYPAALDAYYDVVLQTATATITKIDPTIVITTPETDEDELRDYNTYAVTIGTEGADIIYEITDADGNTEVSFGWEKKVNNAFVAMNANEIPTYAGFYRVTVSTSATTNYNAGSVSRIFEITKADQDVYISTVNRVYNTYAAAIGTDILITSSSDNVGQATTSVSLESMVNAGEYTFYVSIPGDDNYKDFNSEDEETSYTLVISPIEVTYTATIAPVTYKAEAFAAADLTVASVSCSGADLATYLGIVNMSDSEWNTYVLANYTINKSLSGTIVNANTYDDAVSVSIVASQNFTFVNPVLADLTVLPADVTLAITKVAENGDVAKTYNGSAVAAVLVIDDEDADLTYTASILDAAVNNTDYIKVQYYSDVNGNMGELLDAAPVFSGYYWIKVYTVATDNLNANAAGVAKRFKIDKAPVYLSFMYTYTYGNQTYTKYLSYDEVNGFTVVEEAYASLLYAGDAMPVAGSIDYFRTTGFEYDLVPLGGTEQDPYEITAVYTYDVGLGDFDGNKTVTVLDLVNIRKYQLGNLTIKAIPCISPVEAWTGKYADGDNVGQAIDFSNGVFFASAKDLNGDTYSDAIDLLIIREAFATGYGYGIISNPEVTAVSGQSVWAIEEAVAHNIDELRSFVAMGYPVKLSDGTDGLEYSFDAATQNFELVVASSVSIDLNGQTLTVNMFSLTSAADVTLKIFSSKEVDDEPVSGVIYSIEDITVSAPAGNVNISNVDGYVYVGQSVNLAAYNRSLHIEDSVGFYVYQVPDTSKADLQNSITSDSALNDIRDAKIEETEERVQEVKEIKANTDLTSEDKMEQIEALAVRPAKVEIPVDTHVVIEESATFAVEQITVVEAKNDATATSFAIEVKNTDAEVVSVDVTKVKTVGNVDVDVVSAVSITGETTKVELITREEQEETLAVTTIKGVTTEAEMVEALASDIDVINIAADFSVTGSNNSPSSNYNLYINRPVTIIGNGFTITFNKRGFYVEGTDAKNVDTVTIRDIKLVSTANAGRCISLFDYNDTLNLDSVEFVCTGAGNNQAITVGDFYSYPTIVNVNNSVINAGAAGYGIIYFSKVDLTIDNSSLTGYASVYGKGPISGYTGAYGSTVTIADSTFTAVNSYTEENDNSFAVLVDEDAKDYTRLDGVIHTVRNSTFNIISTNTATQAVFIGTFADVFTFENCTYNFKETNLDTAVMTYCAEGCNDDCVLVEETEGNVTTYSYKLVTAGVSVESEIRNALALGATKLVLCDDITLTTAIAADRIAIDHAVELDMNGHSITSSEYAFVVMPGGELNITGEGSFNYVGEDDTKGALRVAGSSDVNADEGKLTLGKDVTIESTGYGIVIWHVSNRSYGSNVVVNGTINSYAAAVCPSGNIKADANDIVNDAPIDAVAKVTIGSTARLSCEHEAALYAAGFANITIEDGAVIVGNVTGVEVRGGFFTMNGGTIISNANATYTKANGNGTTGYGVGLMVAQHTTRQVVNVTINKGNFIGPVAFMQANPENSSAADLAKVSITINGGAFYSELGDVDILPVLSGATAADPAKIIISDEDKITYSMVLAEGDSIYEDESSYIIVHGLAVATEEQFNAAMADDDAPVVSIVKDITFTQNAPISNTRCTQILKSKTIYGFNHTLTLKNNGIYLAGDEVSFIDVNLVNASAAGRCIDSRGGTHTLNIINSTVICTGTSGYVQPITIGGNHTYTIDINIVHSRIDAGTSGGATYAIILFNKANITMTDSSAGAGWAVFYCKAPNSSAGANGSTIYVENSEFTCRNKYSTTSNAFGMIVDEDNGYTRGGITFVAKDSTFNVITTGTCKQALFYGTAYDTYTFDNCDINLEGDAAVITFHSVYDNGATLNYDVDGDKGVLGFEETYNNESSLYEEVVDGNVIVFTYVYNN